ncbi:hypothetical protein [Paracoccus spongiarum]|uniref:Flagellin n=1 Tax=Paracoccus spongiarum TaxID=3064387 RepID=A0ABT9JBY4_9RHOB|nr:hypothetical protein [Paracoccus sp. 2205BS29-5]MDP5307326.1 hypothetical protein [Paracoccus sp. 2205BS29-5]
MTSYSIGDQARAFALQTASHRLKTTLATLTSEMASGEVADLGQRLQGNTQMLRQMEARISMIDQLDRNAAEIEIFSQGMQDVLEAIRGQTASLGLSLLAEPFSETPALVSMRAAEAGDAFETVVSRINGAVGGKYLFSGLNSDAPPLLSAGRILDELELVTAGMTTATDVSQAVSAWFDAAPGSGGFLDTAYQGTIGQAQAFVVGDGQTVELGATAASTPLREVLKGMATSALVDRGLLAGQYHEQRDLLQRGGQIMTDNASEVLAEMGRIGQAQGLTERARTENSSARAALSAARNNLRAADPYETAGAITMVEAQLEALYSVTARLANLKLVDYLR